MASPLDDGIANLERFISEMTESCTRLENDTDEVEAQIEALDDLEGRAAEVMGALGDALETALQEVGTAEQDALDAIETLSGLAEEVAQARLAAASDRLDSGVESFASGVNDGQKELEDGQERLSQQGFDALASTLADLGGEVEGLEGEGDGHFDGLRSGLGDMGEDVDEARTTAVEGITEAAAAVAGEVQELAAAGTEATAGWTGELGQGLADRCQAVGDAGEQDYERWESDVRERAGEWAQETVGAVDEASSFLVEETPQTLETPVEQVVEGSGETLTEADSEAVSALAEGEDTVRPLEIMVGELEIVQRTIGDIDRLLSELG